MQLCAPSPRARPGRWRRGMFTCIGPTTPKPLGTEMRAPESPGSVRRGPIIAPGKWCDIMLRGTSVATGEAPHAPLMISSNLARVSTSRPSQAISPAHGLQTTWACGSISSRPRSIQTDRRQTSYSTSVAGPAEGEDFLVFGALGDVADARVAEHER